MKVGHRHELGGFYFVAPGLDRRPKGLVVGGRLQLGFFYLVNEGRELGIVMPVGIFWRWPSYVTSSEMRQRLSLSGRESTWRKLYSIGRQVSTGYFPMAAARRLRIISCCR